MGILRVGCPNCFNLWVKLTPEQVNDLRAIILEDTSNCEELKNLTDQDWENLANGVAGYYLCLFNMNKNEKK